MLLDFSEFLTSVPLASESLAGLLYSVQSAVVAATDLVDFSKGPLAHLLQNFEALLEVGLVRVGIIKWTGEICG